MKATLLFLVLLNLLFFGWSHWVAPPSGHSGRPTPEPEAERIALYREAYPESGENELDVTSLALPVQDEAPGDGVEVADESPVTDDDAAPDAATTVADSDGDTTVASATPETDQAPTATDDADASEPAPSPPAAPEPQTLVVAPPPRCAQLGPFLRLTEATEAAARLRELALEPSQRIEEAEVWVGHWVYLPAFPSRAAAIAEVEKLRAGGITDNYIETAGELRNSVSLGLFSDRSRAEARAAQARELGSDARVRDRLRTGDVYFLDVELPPDLTIDPAEFTAVPNRPVTLEERACPGEG